MRLSLIEKSPPAAAGGVFSLIFCSTSFFLNIINLPVIILSATITVLLLISVFKKSRNRKSAFSLPHIFISAGFGFCALFTAVGSGILIDRSSYTGIPSHKVHAAQVYLKSEPRRISMGRWVAEGFLMLTEDDNVISRAKGRITIFGKGEYPGLASGRIIKLYGTIRIEPEGEARSPYIFSCNTYDPGEWKSKYHQKRFQINSELMLRLSSLSPDTSSFLSALLMGRKTDFGSPLMYLFRKSGCIHILALSGFHVGLIAFALKKILKPFIGFIASSLLSAAGALAFLFLTGMRPSLFRAVLMYLLWTYDSIRSFKISPLSYLSAAFLIQVLLFPLSIYSLSFRLSYAALAGLILSGTAYARLLSRYIPMKIASVFGAGLGAQFITLPLIISSFGIWYPIGILAAPILAALTAAAMALGSLSLVFISSSPGDIVVSRVMDKLIWIITRVSEPFSRVPS
ncbi:MAG: ComEC/Rec2 family competence protein, partial [Spirochaetaceae bacterium]|nr:ComEC/Rec2 family competence protein [Spirochaetaceae bacterium]